MNEVEAIKTIISLINKQQYEEALTLSRKSRLQYKGVLDFYFLEGEVLLRQYKKVSAIEIFKTCIEKGEANVKYLKGVGSTKAYKHIGDIYYDEGDYERALKCYEQGLKSNNRDLSFVKRIGKTLKNMLPNNESVKAELKRFFNLDMQSNVVFFAEILMEIGIVDEAREYVDRALQLEVNFLSLACSQRYYFYKGEYDLSINIYEQLEEEKIDYKAKKYYLLSLIMEGREEEVRKEAKDEYNYLIYQVILELKLGYGAQFIKEKYGFIEGKYVDKVIEALNDILVAGELITFNKVLNILEIVESKKKLPMLANMLYERGIYDKAKMAIFAAIETLDQLTLDEFFLLNKILLN